MHQVNIPYSFDRPHMYDLLSQVIDVNMNPISNKIIFNFSNLDFIDPSGITIMSNLLEWLFKKNVQASFIRPELSNDKRDPIKYLDDSGFFKRYHGENLREHARVRSTTIPLEIIPYTDSQRWLEHSFSHWLSGRLNIPINQLSTIKVCLSEIFNNIRDHAMENIGCIFAQHYPNNKEIKISISDFGVGIPTNIKKERPCLDDGEAIKVASSEGFTTKTSPRNLGAGLHTLIENVVKNNKGSVHIHSNYGILNCNQGINLNEVFKSSTLASGFYPGTLIEIVLKTDHINNIIDIEEEFDWEWD